METTKCNFERGKFIGKGAFGKVYLCFDERQKKFALKIIDLEGSSENERNMAEKEARLLTTLQHKYILHAESVYQENKTLCIVTEFCDQGDLRQFLDKRIGNPLEEKRIVEWFRQICSALEYLHRKNVLHRDIKPQNIFLTGREMTIKLGDLGLAKVLESSFQEAATFCGTPYYMSPEIVAGKPYNFKSDIWAMGVCVYEMTTLRRPFDAYLLQQLFLKIANGQLPSIPKDDYSPHLIKVIERMLCRDSDSRPSATELLQDVLFKNQQTTISSGTPADEHIHIAFMNIKAVLNKNQILKELCYDFRDNICELVRSCEDNVEVVVKMNEILDDPIIITRGKGENKLLVTIHSETGVDYKWTKETWTKMFRGLLGKR